ncbi:serine acetyltransferase [bacterium]|nr:serine acetyltransferase [bacterium]
MNLAHVHRFGYWFTQRRIPLIPRLVQFYEFVIYNSYIGTHVKLGKGTLFAYKGLSVALHKHVEVGENCNLGIHLVVGGRSKQPRVPRIGNNVLISHNVTILGDLTIGDNSVIGAGAVVIGDIPANCVAAGVPAKVIRENIDPKEFW